MHPQSAWQAMARPGFLRSSWPWRSAAYLLSGGPLGAVLLIALAAGTAVGGVLAVVVVGLPLLAALALVGLPVGALERRRLRWIDPAPTPSPHRPPARTGLWAWAVTRYREQATWRELAYALLLALVLWPLDLLAVTMALAVPLALVATPALLAAAGDGGEVRVLKVWAVGSWPASAGLCVLGVLLLAAGGYALTAFAGARVAVARALLAPRDTESARRITELTRSRVRLVDAFETERRRIERDLHDGAQQRLVALTMTLGLARLDAPPGPFADLLAGAHHEAEQVLVELRELIHDIHPRVLADYGLEAAAAEAADRSPIPAAVVLDLPGRLPQAVEATAYFVVREALANAARHSGASRVTVTGEHRDRRLTVEIRDDGHGGASVECGTGLLGLADRVSVLDGRLTLSSPSGGPTLLRVEIPCETTAAPRAARTAGTATGKSAQAAPTEPSG
jgi:signal transduction histidine kinase